VQNARIFALAVCYGPLLLLIDSVRRAQDHYILYMFLFYCLFLFKALSLTSVI